MSEHAGDRRGDGVTILVWGRNRRAHLPRALRSALDALGSLDAAGTAAEIVAVDDASSDGSQKLLRGVRALYGEERLRVRYHEEGDGDPLDAGLRTSSYRLVCVMNARNELMPANLPLFARGASETGAAMVYGNVLNKRGGAVAGVRSSMPVVPGLPKSRDVDGLCIVDAGRLQGAGAPTAGWSGARGWELALRLQELGEEIIFVPAVLGYRHERAADGGPGDAGAPPHVRRGGPTRGNGTSGASRASTIRRLGSLTNRDAGMDSPEWYLGPLRRYRETVAGLFSERGERAPRDPLSAADVLFLGHFLREYPREVVAVEAGAGPGVPALWLAGQPGVAAVTSVDAGSRSSDVFSAVLAEHPGEREKIRVVGGIGDVAPEDGSSGGRGMVALLDASGGREAVGAGLADLFRLRRDAVVFLVGCRGDGAPFAQAGAAAFLGSSSDARRFRAVADLGPALALSGLGIVYAEASAAEVGATVERVAREFTQKLDPLRLLGREEDLVAAVTDLNRRLSEAAERERRLEDEHADLLKEQRSRLRKRISSLEVQLAELRSRQSARRYRLADALAERALRVPGLNRLARGNDSSTGGS